MSSEPGVTYYITVRAVNAVGPGAVNGYAIVNGKWNRLNIHWHELIIQCHYFPQPLQHYSQLILFRLILLCWTNLLLVVSLFVCCRNYCSQQHS